jgi:hypothetical protein
MAILSPCCQAELHDVDCDKCDGEGVTIATMERLRIT